MGRNVNYVRVLVACTKMVPDAVDQILHRSRSRVGVKQDFDAEALDHVETVVLPAGQRKSIPRRSNAMVHTISQRRPSAVPATTSVG